MTGDFSKAILRLSENGELVKLENKWFALSQDCSSSATDNETESLGLKSFWSLFVISGATSTICFLLFLIRLLNKYCDYEKANQGGNATPSEKNSVWRKAVAVARYIYHGETAITGNSPSFSPSSNFHEWISPRWKSSAPCDIPKSLSVSSFPPEIEVVNILNSSRESSEPPDDRSPAEINADVYWQSEHQANGSPNKTGLLVLQAENFIKEKGVKAILGMERWEEAALVADIGSQAQVPVLSFDAPAITPPLTPSRWPFLVRMVYNDSEQMRCIAELTRAYNWRRVVAIYEDNIYGGDSGELALLSQALQEVGSEIEHRLVLPPFALISDPKEAVKEELTKLQEIKSRVFVVLQTSFPLVTHLFREAKNMGLVGKDTVWILTDTVTSLLDSFNTSVIYSMEGALGIKSYYSDSSSAYKSFHARFRKFSGQSTQKKITWSQDFMPESI
ncbi:hypothetical protein GH714_002886 [Hevea brasiliensis]|uniref:Receptor ligand binding region domain-containing protein n=1 Tax=Hevea brasiliensis TaxID=3981 RepID=A0A6A6LYS0_HEVBR|nr:hypothetical protein GH714_002886 [Hevea brasiliensis]